MTTSTGTIVIAAILIFGVAAAIYSSSKSEKYSRLALSQKGPFKRTPAPTAFRGNGMEFNPHYQADPSDRLVPLEYGGTDFYKSQRREQQGRSFEEFCDCYQGRGDQAINMMNDDKTRKDLVDAGDLGWNRVLTNIDIGFKHMPFPVTTEDDITTATVKSYSHALYNPAFHFHVGS